MGGRGASYGVSDKGNPYGSQYHTIFQSGNIKFVTKNTRQSEPLMETMTRGRIYVTVNGDKIQKITLFDTENERKETIELDHPHKALKNGHAHQGYFHNENDTDYGASPLSNKDSQILDRVNRLWDNYKHKHSK